MESAFALSVLGAISQSRATDDKLLSVKEDQMRLAILTGGGDVPGLNPAIKTVANRALDAGHEILGIRRGWRGLLFYNPDDPATHEEYVVPLTRNVVRTIDRSGGTFLHSSRTKPSNTRWKDAPEFLRPSGDYDPNAPQDLTFHVLETLEHLGVDVLIPIGGEDTLGYGARIHSEGFPVVCIPKTMDNDVPGTDYCLGFSTAITRCVQYINQMRSCVGSHERIGVFELFGRHSGATALFSTYLSGADRTLIPEVPFDMEKVARLVMQDKAENPSHYAIVIISEGAVEKEGGVVESGEADAFGHKKLGGIGQVVNDEMKRHTGSNTMYQQIGYLMRSGPPDALDLMVASNFGNLAMDLVEQGKFGVMVALQEGRYTCTSASAPSGEARTVDVDAFYDPETYRPKMNKMLGMPLYLY
jgi:6-phosphofructokinase